MAKESEDPEVALAWTIYDRVKQLISLQSPDEYGTRKVAIMLDGYMVSFSANHICHIADLLNRPSFEERKGPGPYKVFGAYIDGGALLFDMPDADYCRNLVLPLLDKELVLDRLAGL